MEDFTGEKAEAECVQSGDDTDDDDEEEVYRDPPTGSVRLRPSTFAGLPATIFIEYPPELVSFSRSPSLFTLYIY
jgi:hypothetical protein